MKVRSPNIKQLLILSTLIPGSPLSLSTINSQVNRILRTDKPHCYLSREINSLFQNECIDYCNNGKKQADGKKYVSITVKGKDYYRMLVNDFQIYYKTIEQIYLSISDVIG